MIEEIDRSLERWLRAALPLPPGNGDVHFDRPERDWDARRSVPLVNLYLYSLHRSRSRATSGGSTLVLGDHGGLVRERPVPIIEAHYLVTVWAGSAGVEHELLGRLVNLFVTSAGIPDEHLSDALRLVNPPPTLTVAPDETVSTTGLWSGLEVPPRPSVQLLVHSPMAGPSLVAAADPPASIHLGFTRVAEPAAFAPRRRVLARVGAGRRAPVRVTIEDSARGGEDAAVLEFPVQDGSESDGG